MKNMRTITAADDAAIAEIIRYNLKKAKLDIPGTVYFDECLDHLSAFYLEDTARRTYFILTGPGGQVVGGIGLAEFEHIAGCAELQKLYLAEEMKGLGLGYQMIAAVEEKAGELGYSQLYLETHTNLPAAIHIYEKYGFREIEKPEGVVHATMNKFYLKDIRRGGE